MVAKENDGVSRQAQSQARLASEGRCPGGRAHRKPEDGFRYCRACRRVKADRATAKREEAKRAAHSACGSG